MDFNFENLIALEGDIVRTVNNTFEKIPEGHWYKFL